MTVAANDSLLPSITVSLTGNELCISPGSRDQFLRVYDEVPFLERTQVFPGATQHLVQCVVRVKLPRCSIKNTDADLGVLENRTEQLLACLQNVLCTRAFRDVFG